jgi:hypothetical protein
LCGNTSSGHSSSTSPRPAAPARRLAVEVDGGYHALRIAADARRDAKLRRWGWRVLRLDARLVVAHPAEAVAHPGGARGGLGSRLVTASRFAGTIAAMPMPGLRSHYDAVTIGKRDDFEETPF